MPLFLQDPIGSINDLDKQFATLRAQAVRRVFFQGLGDALEEVREVSEIYIALDDNTMRKGIRTIEDDQAWCDRVLLLREDLDDPSVQRDMAFYEALKPLRRALGRHHETIRTLAKTTDLDDDRGYLGRRHLRLSREEALAFCALGLEDPDFCIGQEGAQERIEARVISMRTQTNHSPSMLRRI